MKVQDHWNVENVTWLNQRNALGLTQTEWLNKINIAGVTKTFKRSKPSIKVERVGVETLLLEDNKPSVGKLDITYSTAEKTNKI